MLFRSADTIRVVYCYADIVAMRHPKEGAPLRASRYSRIPVINAGDGGHQHPTQTMTARALDIPQGTAATRQRKALRLLRLELVDGEEVGA